jgi:hypothetical protein
LAKSGTQAFFGFTGIGEFVAVTFARLFIGTFFLGFLSVFLTWLLCAGSGRGENQSRILRRDPGNALDAVASAAPDRIIIAEAPHAGQRSESRQRGRPW